MGAESTVSEGIHSRGSDRCRKWCPSPRLCSRWYPPSPAYANTAAPVGLWRTIPPHKQDFTGSIAKRV